MAVTPDLLERIRGEFREMPGMKLTIDQACRLWNLNDVQCRDPVDALIAERFLIRTPSGPQTPTFTGSHQEAFCGGKSLNRLREEMFLYHSMQLTGIVFQACSFNHSDISPFRINDLRAPRRDYRTRRRPFLAPTRSCLNSATWSDLKADVHRNCVRPPHLL